MGEAQFDRYVETYEALHEANIRLSGEEPSYFAEYKVREVAGLLKGEVIAQVLDFGAGLGTSVPYFRTHFPESRLVCVDVSRDSLGEAARRHGAAAQFVTCDGGNIPLGDGSCDLVFAACVFHHIPHADHPNVLSELRRVLRPGGNLFVFEHNPLNPVTVHAVNTCPFDADAELVRAGPMRRRVRGAGFSIMKTDYCIFFPQFLRALRPLEKYLAWFPLGAQYFVWAKN